MITASQTSVAGRHLRRALTLIGFCGLLAIYLPTIALTFRTWSANPYGGHSLFVPLFCVLLLWWDRDRLLRLQAHPQPLHGLSVLAGALALLTIGRLTHNLTLQWLSVVLALFGVVVYRLGAVNLRLFAFPFSFLLLMHPLPNVLVAAISPHVRTFAADFASVGLYVLGVPHYQQGFLIQLPSLALEIAEGCNGLRFLMALFTLTVVLAQTTQGTPLRKIILAAASVPLAVVANAIRITAVTVGAYYIGPEIAADLPHHSIGKVVWLLTLLPLGLLAYLLRRQPASSRPSSDKPNSAVVVSQAEGRQLLEVTQQSARGDHVG